MNVFGGVKEKGFAGQTGFVTGASSGVDAAVPRELGSAGGNVVGK